MASKKSAMKRQRQNEKKRDFNKHYGNMMKVSIKKLLAAVENKKKSEARELLKSTISIIDKLESKGIIHKNNAARKISKLSKSVKAL